MPPRISQRGIMPTAVKSRSFGNVIKLQETVTLTTTMNNGDELIVDLLIINNQSANIIVEPEFSIYQDSVSAANLIPFGSAIAPAEYQIIGPWNEWTGVEVFTVDADDPIPSRAVLSHIFIRNISAGASTPIII